MAVRSSSKPAAGYRCSKYIK